LNNRINYIYRRYLVKIFGVVQGVGFRPFIYKLALLHDLKGYIKNMGAYVFIDIEGSKNDLKEFFLSVVKSPPPLARIEKIDIKLGEYNGHKEFRINDSGISSESLKFISPDIATCPKCINEILDSNSRYSRYPFTNCTECGPRYSIIKKLPYDRDNTVMEKFTMCKPCRDDYLNPLSRRFHAQPTCCSSCGPSLILVDNKGNIINTKDPIKTVVELILKGKIVAIKGIGGFHITCNGEDERAIEILRIKKRRPHKPLAIMVKDIEKAKRLCLINSKEEVLLCSNKRPIVLLEKRKDIRLPNNIAPRNKYIGVILPYTPIHHLIFEEKIESLVMTSGNISDAPIQYINEEAEKHLKEVADYILLNDRDINVPIEDSVVRVIDTEPIMIRLGRGYAPLSIKVKSNDSILALGAEQKGSYSFSYNGYGYLSEYIGDLKDFNTYSQYKKTIENLLELFDYSPEAIAYDLNQDFLSTQYASNFSARKFPIQHHHAHMVSVMAEHSLYEKVIGIIYDGTGLGIDGCIWGGEFLVGDRKGYSRAGHLKYVSIQGGNKAIEEPWRIALSYLYELKLDYSHLFERNNDELDLITEAIEKNINCFNSSSMGRLFDCVSSLLGLVNRSTYEGQGGVELEYIVDTSVEERYNFSFLGKNLEFEVDYSEVIYEVLKDINMKISPSVISTKFHNTVTALTIEGAKRIKDKTRINYVVLSGGVFQNEYLLTKTYDGLVNEGFKVFYNKIVPINDNGIAFGQMAIASELMKD